MYQKVVILIIIKIKMIINKNIKKIINLFPLLWKIAMNLNDFKRKSWVKTHLLK